MLTDKIQVIQPDIEAVQILFALLVLSGVIIIAILMCCLCDCKTDSVIHHNEHLEYLIRIMIQTATTGDTCEEKCPDGSEIECVETEH